MQQPVATTTKRDGHAKGPSDGALFDCTLGPSLGAVDGVELGARLGSELGNVNKGFKASAMRSPITSWEASSK